VRKEVRGKRKKEVRKEERGKRKRGKE